MQLQVVIARVVPLQHRYASVGYTELIILPLRVPNRTASTITIRLPRCSVKSLSSLSEMSELMSRTKYGSTGIVLVATFTVVDRIFKKEKKRRTCSGQRSIWAGTGSG